MSQTKNYLVLKIPLRSVKEGRVLIDDPERAAVLEGIKAIKEGRISEALNGAKEAISFLKGL